MCNRKINFLEIKQCKWHWDPWGGLQAKWGRDVVGKGAGQPKRYVRHVPEKYGCDGKTTAVQHIG